MSRALKDHQEVKYVYDLPYTERKLLCNILDTNNDWERLGGAHMHLKWRELDEFRRAERCGESPTDRLLQTWGQQNHTVTELFLLLWQMKHFQAMRALKTCIPAKYHKLFTDDDYRITGIIVRDSPSMSVVIQEAHRSAEGNTSHHTVLTSSSTASRSNVAALASSKNSSHSTDGKSSTSFKQTSGHTSINQSNLQSHTSNSMEGACALDPSQDHNLHLPDPKPVNHNYYSSSSKVPMSLLCPTPGTNVITTSALTNHVPYPKKPPAQTPTTNTVDPPKQRIPTACNPKKASILFPPEREMEKKLNNNESFRNCSSWRVTPEVSCEDNNPEEMKSKVKGAPYDPDQDYMNKLEEKRAKEAARENRGKRSTSGHTSTSSSGSITVAQPGGPVHVGPASPANQQQPSNSRKISNVSDPECLYSSVPAIPYKELEEATALWSQHNLLGRGGFGAVFKGTWKNTEVAIKRIEPHGHASLDNTRLHITQSLEELKLLQSYRHDNILQVYGYSTDHEMYPCLVYQFMPHGSVEDRLQCRRIEAFGEGTPQRGPEVLGWRQRFRIALGTAGALQFLHTVKEKPLIHGDVKSANILLDQNYEPKLGDFGLAREGKSQSTSIKVSRVHGTKPYLPGDYLRNKKLSVKVDTYSFGIVLFELCTGLRAYDEKRKEGQKFLWELVEESDREVLRDKKAGGSPDNEVFTFLFQLGKGCVHQRASLRPDMTTVFKELENLRIVMEDRARARRISMGESSSGCSSPHMLQVRYDTAGSLLSPSTLPSYPPYFHPPSSPSAVSTLPPSPSSGMPRSPVPPGTPHYFPHPSIRPTYPGMVNGQFSYHPRMFPQGSQAVWMPGPADNLVCGMAPLPQSVPKYYGHHNTPGAGTFMEHQDPPSYSETMSQPPIGAAAVLPIIPQLSGLNMTTDSESVYSDLSDSKSSLVGNTAHCVRPPVLSQHQTPDPDAGANGPIIPLLTELNNKSDSSLSVSSKKPTAAKKKFSLFD